MNGYDKVIQSGLKSWPDPKAFNELYPGSSNVASYYTGIAGETKWTSEANLFNHYIFRMFRPIVLDKERTTIVSAGAPVFDLYEIKRVVTNANGTFGCPVRLVAKPSVQDWHALIDAKGSFAAIGINLETNKPVDGFEHIFPLW